MSINDRPETLAKCYRNDPEAFRAVLADAERQGLDVLAEPMRATIEAVEGPA